jgi:hypothetical protein
MPPFHFIKPVFNAPKDAFVSYGIRARGAPPPFKLSDQPPEPDEKDKPRVAHGLSPCQPDKLSIGESEETRSFENIAILRIE